jgi:hypothetical protein
MFGMLINKEIMPMQRFRKTGVYKNRELTLSINRITNRLIRIVWVLSIDPNLNSVDSFSS